MLNIFEIVKEAEPHYTKTSVDKPRILYQKPCLEELGDLRTLTLGGSPGFGDSSSGYTCEFPGLGGDGMC